MRFLILLLIPLAATAHDFTFTWNDPVKRTDGSALNPNTELKSYRMECSGPESAARLVDRSATVPVNTNRRQYVWADAVLTDGTYACKMTAVDTGELESDWSNEVSVLKVEMPEPPTNFREDDDWVTSTINGSIN